MKYNDQKTMAYLKIFLGFLILGYNAVKYVKSGYNLDSINIMLVIAVGVLLPLSSVFGLKRAKAERKQKELLEKEQGNL